MVSISTLFHVGQDLFLNFFYSSSGFVTPTQNKLLKWGAKDASRGAKDASEDGTFKHYSNIISSTLKGLFDSVLQMVDLKNRFVRRDDPCLPASELGVPFS